MTASERTYRRLLRLYPERWRRVHEEEMIAVLLAASCDGERRPSLVDRVDVVAGALRLRFRPLRQPSAAVAILALAAALLRFLVGSSVSTEFLVTSLVVVLIPGTGVVYTVSSAIGGGWRRGLFAAVGCTLGIVPHLAAAAIGVSGVMQAGATAFEIVRWVGVAYLAFMGISMIRSGGGLELDDDTERDERPMGKVVQRGILLNLLNPKLTVFFFAFLPQFLDTNPTRLDTRLIGLGLIFMAITLVVFVAYAYSSAAVRDRVLSTPLIMRWVQRSLGAVLVGFAARLAVADR